MPEHVILRAPTPQDEAACRVAHQATSPSYPSFLHFHDDGMTFGQYLEVLRVMEAGWGLAADDDLVPETFLFAFLGEAVVGRAAIRHRLTPALARLGGHIGYVVVPAYRRRGYATEILRQSLDIARRPLGLTRVLLTCDDDNLGSIRTIEKNGGVLENRVTAPHRAVPKRRYWIART